jgi:hypothetical protein
MEVSENDGTPSHHPSFFGIFHFKPLDLGVFDLLIEGKGVLPGDGTIYTYALVNVYMTMKNHHF